MIFPVDALLLIPAIAIPILATARTGAERVASPVED